MFVFVCVLGLVPNKLFSQTKPTDSASVQKEYTLPDPTRYESFYDIETGMYFLYPKIGNTIIDKPIAMTLEEYSSFILSNKLRDYYEKKSRDYNTGGDTPLAGLLGDQKKAIKDAIAQEKKSLLPSLSIKNKLFENAFGGNKIELIPQGFASFDLGVLYQKTDNPMVLPQNRTDLSIDIRQRIQLGITGKIGENLQLKANYDTQSGFAFENKMNIVWEPKQLLNNAQDKVVGKINSLQNRTIGQLGNMKNSISNSGAGLVNKGLTNVQQSMGDNDDRIIKKLEFGNVNMSVSNGLIRGSESLFGLKTEFQLGKTSGTFVFSQQQGEARTITVQGGGMLNTFKINAVDYEDNQHYYIGHYFLDNYDNSLLQYPLINSKININRLEVWVLDQSSVQLQDQKGIVAVRDLGEGTGYPDNSQNNLHQSIISLGQGIRDASTAYNTINGKPLYDVVAAGNVNYVDGENFIFNKRARKLSENEYTYSQQLGYISLNQRLNDNQLLAVSYTYTINGSTKVYKVGEFSEESPVLITKLIKPNTRVKTTSPMWDLMMKNVYSLDAGQVEESDFLLNVYYKDATEGRVNYLPGTPVQDINLLRLFNWDRLDAFGNLQQSASSTGDGIFDFQRGITINPETGKLYFTKAKPFGSYLQNTVGITDTKFLFNELYTEQKQIAAQSNVALRYTIEGRYKGQGQNQGQGIALGAINVPRGSVKVTANGKELTEGVDYTVDYMLGRVLIINEMVKQSGQAINISLENQMNFNTQRKRFLGLNLERRIGDNLLVGGTFVNYSEKPLTQKVDYGNEAVNNSMVGMNILYNNRAPFLTRFTDNIPLINTEAESNINFKAEAAYLIPGQNKGMNDQSYIDDFEQTMTKISLKDPAFWGLASMPEKNPHDPVFSNSSLFDNLAHGYKRGLISWYNIDPRFYGLGGNAPSGITAESISKHMSRRIHSWELYGKDYVAGEQTYLNTLDVTFFPKERGPYNFNLGLENPKDRWGGLMRPVTVSNFVNANVEYVEFWMMDPYADGETFGANPKLLLHLGNVSEDVLKDGKLLYENGLPTANDTTTKIDNTNWGIQPKQSPILYTFSSEGANRRAQDVGFDGLDNEQEATKFGTGFINPVTQRQDPASDDFVFYMSGQFQGPLASSVRDRYRYFRNPDGNSNDNSVDVSSQTPDAEDINGDFNLDQDESYNQYTIKLDQASLAVGQNYIVDSKEVEVKFENGQTGRNKWYLFRVPVEQFDTSAGDADLNILSNVRFARMVLKDFDDTSTIRFGSFDLVRSEWRKYTKAIASSTVSDNNEGIATVNNSNFDISTVSIEENANSIPPYVLPPGVSRQVLSGTAGVQRQNESSLSMKVTNLGKEARGIFKNVALDMRRFKNLEMFVHAQDLKNQMSSTVDPNAKFFIRLGSDATDNYYEYEASLKYTPKNATSPLDIWPDENNMKLVVDELVNIKQRRDRANVSLDSRYTDSQFGDANKKIYVKGRPSLGNVTTIIIGVRNFDNLPKDLLLWLNEIRLSEIETKGSYAGNAALDFNLGDFATVTTNASYTSIGFGSIIERPSERSQTENTMYNIATTVNLDKFFPEKIGLKIPVNYSYSKSIEDPKYNPLDNDVKLKDAINQDQVKDVARTSTQQRSIGVVNMRKERMNTQRKPRFYDVENLSLTTVYSDDTYKDVYTKANYKQYLKGYVDYNYAFKPLEIRPFNKLIGDTIKAYKYLRWLDEFNFNPIPTRLSFRTELDRTYNELEYRNVGALLSGNAGQDFDAIKNRSFFFGWQYNLGFNLTRSLKLDVNSNTKTANDYIPAQNMDRGSIFQSPFKAGRAYLYNHNAQIIYRLPFEMFPYLDFINAEAGYGFQYNWSASSSVLVDQNIGNLSQNTNTITATSSVDIPKLLGNFKFFQKLDEKRQNRRVEIDSMNSLYNEIAEKNLTRKRKLPYRDVQFKNKLTFLESLAYGFTSIKQTNFSYNENNGTALPGILSSPNFFGSGTGVGGPTFGFLVGSQADIRRKAIENNWITNSDLLNTPYTQMQNKSITAGVVLEPMSDLRIDLNFLKNSNRNLIQNGYNILINNNLAFEEEVLTHSYSDFLIRTSFKDGGDIYKDMVRFAREISQGMGGTLSPTGFSDGYSLANPYVLIPAFKAAVEGRTPDGIMTDPEKTKFPLPNWKISYTGLSNIPFINSKFSRVEVLHSYTSTYTNAGFKKSVDYYNYETNKNQPNPPDQRDKNGDYYMPYTFAQLGYIEEFAPFMGVDLTARNNMQFRAMYNRSRMYSLSLSNHSLMEDSSSEYVVGFGYILKDLKVKFRFRGKPTSVTSDLNVRADFSLRDNISRITNILIDDSQVTSGQKIWSIKLSADYNMSENFNLKLFYDQMITKYKISTAFPLSTINAGISATFTFGGSNIY